jgi:hypothetical protein
LEFDAKVFTYSPKWLLNYKKAYGINVIDMHGEGADADLDSVAIVRREIPPFLAEAPHENIYNFYETCDHPSVVVIVVVAIAVVGVVLVIVDVQFLNIFSI